MAFESRCYGNSEQASKLEIITPNGNVYVAGLFREQNIYYTIYMEKVNKKEHPENGVCTVNICL